MGFLDPFPKNPSSCTILLPNPNSNGCPLANLGLLASTCISGGLNTTKRGFIFIMFFCNSLACGPPCVYCCCCYYKFYGLILIHPVYICVSLHLWLLFNLWRLGIILPLDLLHLFFHFVFHVEMTFVAHQHFASLPILMLA